ncbi:MAG: hypothetical protein U9N79_12185 [Actinomycetota bacterium]|nr:hypothetical protein [Actinomycetota bacterium]
MQLFFGMLLLIAGLAVTASALPLTNRLAQVLPHWTLSRGQVEQLASTTFLTAFIGLLMTVTGVMAVLIEVLPN